MSKANSLKNIRISEVRTRLHFGYHAGSVKQWQWIKYEGDAAAMAASQTYSGFTGTYARLTPDSSGVGAGVSFVEFRNINSFSTFGAMAFTTNNLTLPVSLSSFTATLQDDCSAVKLNWFTGSEQNSKNFIIQRSTNGNSWNNIGTVTAEGNSAVTKKYSYSDPTVKVGGTWYYRLQMNDLNGRQKNSKILGVKLNCGAGQYLVYPNPARDHITIQLPTAGGQKVLAVYNGIGQRMLQTNSSAGTVQTISTTHWKQGMYLVIITENGKPVHTQKVVKE